MVGAYCVNGASHGIPLRNVHCKFPISPPPGLKAKLKPNVNHITLRRAIPKNICIKIETVFFFLSKPASNNPNEGIINNTRLDAINIHAVSPVSMANS